MKKLLLILAFLAVLLPSAIADAFEVTSPFGMRFHPIRERWILHTGVDIAATLGDSIQATDGGLVTATPYDEFGYGQYVIIRHSSNEETLYAHLDFIAVSIGQTVTKGEVIGAAGSSGGSTGPHLHFEYILNGVEVDPVPYLVSKGWDVTFGSGFNYDPEGFGGFNEVPWNFEGFFSIGEKVREILEIFSEKTIEGLDFIKVHALDLLYALILIDFTLYLCLNGMSLILRELIKKVLKYCFLIFLVKEWGFFINDVILSFFTSTATVFASTSTGFIEGNISDPSLIIQKGVYLLEPAIN